MQAASRVTKATHETFDLIASNPGIGQLCKFQSPRLRDIHFRPVAGFAKHLVFYRKTPYGIHVIHVLHTARNIEKLFRRK
jgi:toxin ParE1/3/4